MNNYHTNGTVNRYYNKIQNSINGLDRLMYYNEFDQKFGIGFYPRLSFFPKSTTTIIKFRLQYIENIPCYWIQSNNSVIYGFESGFGSELLDSLNIEAGVNVTQIMNVAGRIIHPKIANSPYHIL